MKSNFRYITAAPTEIIGSCDVDFIMNTAFNIREKGKIQICFGDTVEFNGRFNPQNMTCLAYPNGGNAALNKQDLWLSMFTRLIEDSVIEIEEEN